MKRLHPSFRKMNPMYSGISHHMMFSREYVKEMMQMVEMQMVEMQMVEMQMVGGLGHDASSGNMKPFWQIFIECVKEHLHYPTEVFESGASEYEIYFNFMLQYHNDLVRTRILKWDNFGCDFDIDNNNDGDLDYASIFWYC
jgi:hypothetical protein